MEAAAADKVLGVVVTPQQKPMVGYGSMAEVQDALEGVPVAGFLCFVESDWGLLNGAFSVAGVEVLWPRKLAARVKSAPNGPLDVAAIAAALAAKFRPA